VTLGLAIQPPYKISVKCYTYYELLEDGDITDPVRDKGSFKLPVVLTVSSRLKSWIILTFSRMSLTGTGLLLK